MSRQVRAGEPVTKGRILLEPKEASLLKKTVHTTPLKKERQDARKFPLSPTRQSSLPTLPKGNVEEQYDEATAIFPLDQREADLNLSEASLCVSQDTKMPVISPMDIPMEVAELLCISTLDSGSEDVPILERVPSVVCSTPAGSKEQSPVPLRLIEHQRLKEVVLSNRTSEDVLLHEQFGDVVCSRPEDTNARIASVNDDKALAPSPSTPILSSSTSSANTDAGPEAETDTIVAGEKSAGSSEGSKEGKEWVWEAESLSCQSSDTQHLRGPSSTIRALPQIPLPPSPPLIEKKDALLSATNLGPLVIHEDASGKAHLSDTEVNQDGAEAPLGNPTAFEITKGVASSGYASANNAFSAEDHNSTSPEGASPRPTNDAEKRQDAPDPPNPIDGIVRVTRSGARFSDETNMLRDFLNRAQARKAARDLFVLATHPGPAIPLRRSPRKALAEIGNNSPSPEKPRHISTRPGTPPGKPIMESVDGDDLDEVAPETTSFRRSMRTRLFTPARPAPGAPSLIPVRRADGADNIILHRSSAQELAMITRANTRRNKGQSKPPKLALQGFPTETSSVAVLGPYRNGRKSVGWDQPLVYFQAAAGARWGKEGKRTRARKVGSPGGWNGTRAPKKETMEALSSDGASGPKRRGKSAPMI
jgi:hypothetical protein